MKTRYLFVPDQGRPFGTADDPTSQDFDHAAAGVITILRLADLQYFDGLSGGWRALPRGKLVAPDLGDEEVSSPFHSLD